jgi:hypothetical protein
MWLGATMLIEGWTRYRRGRDLAERLLRFQARSVADEAEEWLGSRS